ncbi:biotin--[acetyl-CoA-carboxylase] ligase [Desulfonatronovibrio hydrogenovorans]|uniref:biotin--[acetyl-CoA-carboxylase] ligase n=1 Tax=Desulfonatronovibrio hydrogenovorans TaxID=53245 RepID=UPI00068DCF2E|nr:biotin--[acetyl-CoA-carboxylase] ligase [Desulfonatronovibrio hydrogenovorans]
MAGFKKYILSDLVKFPEFSSFRKNGVQSRSKYGADQPKIMVQDWCTSSMDMAWELVKMEMISPGDSVLCLRQTKGRGRMRREWVSPAGNIYGALMLPRPQVPEMDRILSLIVGYALRQALLGLGVALSIKWPNDLILDDKKVGGILLEEKKQDIVAGIGLNLRNCPENISSTGEYPVMPGHLGMGPDGPDPLEFWAQLIHLALFWYEDILCDFSLIDFIREINSNLWLTGEKVRIFSGDDYFDGVLMGVGDMGEALVDCSGRVERVTSGTIRKHPG